MPNSALSHGVPKRKQSPHPQRFWCLLQKAQSLSDQSKSKCSNSHATKCKRDGTGKQARPQPQSRKSMKEGGLCPMSCW